MKPRRAIYVLLCTTLLWAMGVSQVLADATLTSYSRVDRHWVCDELAEFKQRIAAMAGPESEYDAITEQDKDVIRRYILSEEYLDQPIKAEHWAILLNAILKIPVDGREQLLNMYVFGLATGEEITREDAVGGMIKLLTLKHIKGSVTAEELEPAKALKDLNAISERQEGLVRIAYCTGLLDSRTADYFRPKDRLLVAEAISMAGRIVEKFDITYGTGGPAAPTPGRGQWVSSELNQYRENMMRKLAALKVAEAILLGEEGAKDEVVFEPVTVKMWSEVLQQVLGIADQGVLHTYTSGLVRGSTVPRDAAVAGLVKLLHYNGMLRGRDATEQERLAAATAFKDYASAMDASKLAIAFSERLINGYPDRAFRPGRPLTRGEALILLMNVIQRYK